MCLNCYETKNLNALAEQGHGQECMSQGKCGCLNRGLVKVSSVKKMKRALYEQCTENIGKERALHGLAWKKAVEHGTSYKLEQTGPH